MEWWLLIIGGVLVMDIVSSILSHIGFRSRRETVQELTEKRIDRLSKAIEDIGAQSNVLESTIRGNRDYFDRICKQIETDLRVTIEYAGDIRDMYDRLAERVTVACALMSSDADEATKREQIRLLEECIKQDNVFLERWDLMRRQEREEHTARILERSKKMGLNL